MTIEIKKEKFDFLLGYVQGTIEGVTFASKDKIKNNLEKILELLKELPENANPKTS